MSKFWPYFVALVTFFIGLVGNTANLLQMATLENGRWWLSGLLVIAIGYKMAEYLWGRWQLWHILQSKLDDVTAILLAAGQHNIIREYALILRIRQQGHAIHVREVLSPDLLVIDVSKLALRGKEELKGTKWAFLSQNGSGQVQMQGEVVSCDRKQAHVRLSQPSSVTPKVGDLATPLLPAQATETEQLAGELLAVIGYRSFPQVSS